MSLLVNFVYCHPVGHAIEALHYCHGYRRANPDARIGVVLNSATPVEFARWCSFVDEVYSVPVDVFDGSLDYASMLAEVPSTWDYVVDDVRGHESTNRAVFPGLAAYYDAAGRHFDGAKFGCAGTGIGAPPDYRAGEHFRLPLPGDARGVPFPDGGPRIAILPAGSDRRALYPSMRSWRLITDALLDVYPDAVFCVTGKVRADERTNSSFTRAEFDELLASVPREVSAVDIPLAEQLATVRSCDVLVSPHSGFSMAALAAGTPWLTIAGNKWPEYYFNGVPFYSVLPDVERFPCYTLYDAEPEMVDDDGPRSPSMCVERISADLGQIVDGVARLVEGEWDYDTALADHFQRMLRLRGGDRSMLWSVDQVHLPVLPG